MEYNIFDEKYGNMCRTCSFQSNNNRFVLNYETDTISLVDMLKDCASIEILSTDQLPKVLCENCISQIINFYSFKLICQENEKKLLSLFSQSFTTRAGSHITVKSELVEENREKIHHVKKTKSDNIMVIFDDNYPDNSFQNESKSEKKLKIKPEKYKETGKIRKRKPEIYHKRKPEKNQKRKPEKNQKRKLKKTLKKTEKNQKRKPEINHKRKPEKNRKRKPEKNHKCDQCTLSFYTEDRLISHKELHFERPFKCNNCENSFADLSCLMTHVMTHENKCTICLMEFESATELDTHFKEKHNHPNRKYHCTECNKQFSQITNLKLHFRIHTGAKPYQCTYCGKNFSLKRNLATHILMHTGEKPHSCPYCDKSYTRSHSLKAHILTHNGEKFVCQLCNKSYRWRKSLEHHMSGTHSSVRKFACTICDKKFLFNCGLRRHMDTHLGLKKVCTICGKHLRDLPKHYIVVHGYSTIEMPENNIEYNEFYD